MKKFEFKNELLLSLWFVVALITSIATIAWGGTLLVIIGLINMLVNFAAIAFIILFREGSKRTEGTIIKLKWNRKIQAQDGG